MVHAVIDVARPLIHIPKNSPEERLNSEAVIALAVTHHMIITQCNSANYAVKCIAKYGTKWILIEYMPYGLYPHPVDIPPPKSYSKEVFENALKCVADIIGIYELEPTRVLYVGRIKNSV